MRNTQSSKQTLVSLGYKQSFPEALKEFLTDFWIFDKAATGFTFNRDGDIGSTTIQFIAVGLKPT